MSVLVAAWNEEQHIVAFLHSFLALSYPACDLVLCAGGTDATYAIAARYADAKITVLEQYPGEGKQRALRRCLERATGALIMLTDADCLMADAPFLRLIEPLARRDASVATGVSLPRPEQWASPLVQYQGLSDLAWQHGLSVVADGVLGRNCALRRDLLAQLGAFDAPAATGTDYVLSRLVTGAGYAIRCVVASKVATEYPETLGDYLRMWRRWNKNLLLHGMRYGAWRDVRGVATACAIYGATVALPALTPFIGPLALVGSALLFAQAGANRLGRLALGARVRGTKPAVRTIVGLPLFIALDMLAVFLAVADAVDARKRSRW